MAIADTISSMYENVGEVYDTITNVDVNTGKNLLKYPYMNTTSTVSGVTFTDNGNGSITINGTSTSSTYSLWFLYENAWNYAGLSFELEPGTYTFKALGTDKVSMPINIYFSDNTHEFFAIYNDDVTKTVTEKVKLNMRLLVNGGVSVNNVTIYPQINKGNTALPYQPYTNNPTYKNIENIPKVIRNSYLEIMNNGIDKIWNNWEKVTGSGTDISLSPTLEAPMKNVLNGNTYQFTTTGKNIWDLGSLSGTTQAGVTLRQDIDGGFLLNGTSTGVGRFKIALNTDINETITLYLKSPNNSGDVMISLRNIDDIQAISMRNDNTLKVYSYTPTAPIRYIELIQLTSGVQYTNYKIYPMIVKGSYTSSTIGNYEPYTGGQASPNPDFPSDIHVVSGDNTIKVEGKNLLKLDFVTERPTFAGLTFTHTDSTFTLNGTTTGAWTIFNLKEKPFIENGATYTFSANITGINPSMTISCYFWNKSGQQIGNIRMSKNNNYEITKTINFYGPDDLVYSYATFVIESLTNNSVYDLSAEVQLERNNTKTNFEPYSSNSYPINLGVKNLWNREDVKEGFLPLSGSYPVSNPTYPNSKYIIVPLMKGQKLTLSGSTSSTGRVRCIDKDTNQVVNSFTTVETEYYITTHAFGDGFYEATITARKDFLVGIMDYISFNLDLVVNYGATPQTISDNPIELCDLNTYKDNFLRTSGKNLFNSNITPENYYYDNNGEKVYQSGVEYINQEINNVNYASITISFLSSTGGASVRVCEYNLSGAFITRTLVNTNNQVVNLNNATTKIILSVNSDSNSYFTYLMINKGSSATSYEPYGSGDWYLHKETGKITFNGSENWGRSGNTSESFFCGALAGTGIPFKTKMGTAINSKCDYFTKGNRGSNAEVFDMYNGTDYYTAFALYLSTSKVTDITTFKDWLVNHNITLYYVLYQPTYTEITDNTLLEQLEAFYNAKSKNSQTNITQENNDLPFIIDSTMLKEV